MAKSVGFGKQIQFLTSDGNISALCYCLVKLLSLTHTQKGRIKFHANPVAIAAHMHHGIFFKQSLGLGLGIMCPQYIDYIDTIVVLH